jgi:methyl-accepting chemotaxis protein
MNGFLLRMTPRLASREVGALVLVLAVACLALVVQDAVRAWRQLAAGERVAAVDTAAATLFRAVDSMQLERGRMQNALLAAQPASAAAIGRILPEREIAEAAAGLALAGLGVNASPQLAERIAAARRALDTLNAARAAADAAIRLPRAERPEPVVRGWYGTMTAAVGALNAVWLEASAEASSLDPILVRISETAYLAHLAREDGGVERAGLSGLVAGAVPADPARITAWALRRGAIDSAFRRIEELNAGAGTDPAVAAAIAAARDIYHGQFGSKRAAVLAAGIAGQPMPITLAEWQPLGDRGLEAILGIRDAALVQAKEQLQRGLAAAWSALVTALIEGLVIILVSGLTMLRLRQRLLTPVRGIAGAIGELSRGVAAPNLPKAWREDDEIGTIIGAVRGLAQETAARAEAEAAQKEAAAEQGRKVERLAALIAAFEQDTTQALATVTGSAEALEDTATLLEATAREGVGLTSAVATAADAAAGNTQIAAAAAEELTASVGEISRQVTQASDVARRAAEEAGRTDEAMQGLSVAAERIGAVVQLISGIAGQTNLLALNATIEAARAGEAGKGFAVVASEVKSLAAQTAKATTDISEQIANMRAVAISAVESVRGIGSVVGEINQSAASIAAAVEQQGAATAEIARSVVDVARSTGDVSRDTRDASGAAARTGEVSGKVRSASEVMAREAERMRQRIGGFLEDVRAA